jgi:hypothetical protein
MMKYLLLTRFNVNAFPCLGLPSETWMNHRLEIFERLCFPSVECQTDQNFDWIIFLHPQTSTSAVRRLASLQQRRFFELYFTDNSDVAVLSAVADQYREGGSLITTRLDNDDVIHEDFVKMVRQKMSEKEEHWLNFDLGLRLDHRGLFTKHHRSNAFLSRLEHVPPMSTSLATKHSHISTQANVEHDSTCRAWLQVVHGRNVCNRVGQSSSPVLWSSAKRLLDGYAPQVKKYVASIYSQYPAKKIRPKTK